MRNIKGKLISAAGEFSGSLATHFARWVDSLSDMVWRLNIAFSRRRIAPAGSRTQRVEAAFASVESAEFIRLAVGFTCEAARTWSLASRQSPIPTIRDGRAFAESWFCAAPAKAFLVPSLFFRRAELVERNCSGFTQLTICISVQFQHPGALCVGVFRILSNPSTLALGRCKKLVKILIKEGKGKGGGFEAPFTS